MDDLSDDQLAALSDEELLNLTMTADQPGTDEPAADDPASVVQEETPGAAEGDNKGEIGDEDPDPKADDDSNAPADGDQAAAEAQAGATEGVAATEDHTTPNQTEAEKATEADKEQPDYEALYRQMLAPFKANGREFTPKSPEEAIRLMQMGANYTKKMQDLAPNLKLMRMLQNNGLLDEQKLTFLIDLDQKNPAAIQKLLHDAKVDPMDLDPTAAPAYQPGNHAVSDAEMSLHDTLETVAQTPTGKQTIQLVQQWDQASKTAVSNEPIILKIIDDQRATGIYDKITAELDRRRILGEFANVPFIEAYKAVGDALHAQGALAPSGSASAVPAPAQPVVQPRVLDTRPPRAQVPAASGDKVRALSAAPGKSSTSPKVIDVFSLSDAEIMAMSNLT